MTFEQALTALKQGKKVRRESWDENRPSWCMNGEFIYQGDIKMTFLDAFNDIYEDDWKIDKEPPKLKLLYHAGYHDGYKIGYADGKKSVEKEIYEHLREICNEEIKKIEQADVVE